MQLGSAGKAEKSVDDRHTHLILISNKKPYEEGLNVIQVIHVFHVFHVSYVFHGSHNNQWFLISQMLSNDSNNCNWAALYFLIELHKSST